MKNIIVSLMLLLSLSTAHAESRKMAWVRRIAGISACGLSMWDMAQSAKYTGHGGITEANGLLAGPGGRANIGTMAGIKIGVCAAPLVLGELGTKYHSKALTSLGLIGGIGSAAVSGAIVMHNKSVLKVSVLKVKGEFK